MRARNCPLCACARPTSVRQSFSFFRQLHAASVPLNTASWEYVSNMRLCLAFVLVVVAVALSDAYVILNPWTGRVETDLAEEAKKNELLQEDDVLTSTEPWTTNSNDSDVKKVAKEYYTQQGTPIYSVNRRNPYG